MLKSQLTVCLCSSLFLLPISFAKGKSGLSASKNSMEKALTATVMAPKAHLNSQGMQFVRSYIRKSNRNLISIRHRSRVPFSIIDSVFNRYKLPRELKYLAVIESELKPSAVSHVGAVGPWQLMPATAHILGLKTASRNDERRNYYKSTRAAARYLKDLHREFGDWLLVIAAYNGGPGPVYGAIKKSGSRNFWILQCYLPAETRQHVKRFIATQYYFEGGSSLTTLTRAEGIRYAKTVNAFENSNAKELPPGGARQKQRVSSEDEFKRLMKESEALLQKSNQLLEKNK
jgi:membrane-bound lytic murein transglycosylase D